MAISTLSKRKKLLTERQAGLLAELRVALEQIIVALEQFGPDVSPRDIATVRETITNIEELFLLVIAGEFNSGKSSFVNALLGEEVLPQGVTPTTDAITILRYGDEPESDIRSSGLREQSYPAEVLRHLVVVDTPGTNAVIRHHEELTRDFIPRADLVLFATSADRPFTESERAFLKLIKEWGKKIVFVLNKIDILSESEREQVITFIRDNGRDLLGTTPEIFPLSARLALRARQTEGEEREELWEASQFGAIEHYIIDVLDEETRLRLKLLSPLGVAQHVVETYLNATESRLTTLREDFVTIDNIEQQLGLFRDDLQNDVQYHLNEIEEILHNLEERGMKFFDEHIRLGRLPDLMNSDRMRVMFEEEVVGDVALQIEQRVQTLIDWMIEKDLRLWQSTVDYINRRRAAQHSENLIGAIGSAFDYNRGALMESVGQKANRVVATYDKEQESQLMADEVRASIAATAIAEAGAVGLGALMVVLFHSIFLDVTGVLAATVIAIGGFTLLPAKRRQSKRAFRARIDEMRTQLRQTLQKQFDREVEQSLGRIREAISPYTRFVRAQRGQFTELQQQFSDVDMTLDRLRLEIEEHK